MYKAFEKPDEAFRDAAIHIFEARKRHLKTKHGEELGKELSERIEQETHRLKDALESTDEQPRMEAQFLLQNTTSVCPSRRKVLAARVCEHPKVDLSFESLT